MNNIGEINTRRLIESIALAIAQIILWGGSFFILAILTKPIMKETGWSHQLVYGCLSTSLLVSGLLSPKIGRMINAGNGKVLLLYSGAIMGTGLFLVGVATHYLVFLLGWIVIGVAMAMGLYDALFAALGKKFGNEASKSIVQITLISGFAPTVSWAFVSLLITEMEWRNACFIYAMILIIVVYPIHRFVFSTAKNETEEVSNAAVKAENKSELNSPKVFYLLLTYFTIGAILMTGVSVHLIDILLNKRMSATDAIATAAILGPSQVGARLLDLIFRPKNPVITSSISALFILLGISILFSFSQTVFCGVIFFGLGNGMRSILKGILPLWIYGPGNYAAIMGKLARVPLIAQALTPFLGGFIIHRFGTISLLNTLWILAFINIILTAVLQKNTTPTELNFSKIRDLIPKIFFINK